MTGDFGERSYPNRVDWRKADAIPRLTSRIRELAQGLSVTGTIAGPEPTPTTNQLAGDRIEARWLAEDGYVVLPDADLAEVRAPLVRTIGRLVDEGFPAVFIYLTDAAWALGEALRLRVSAMIGKPYALIADAWAWSIPRGRKGWPPHRGLSTQVFDRHAPELVNVWVALTDVAADRSCMHVIPLPEDPGYPGNLERTDAPLASVRALPVASGTALAWNANVLHWGGPCLERAEGPRVSCSFSLVREDALDALQSTALQARTFDIESRVDLIAMQIATYGEGQPDVDAEVLAWGRATSTIRAKLRSLLG